ncbi:MAG: SDR family NAD(P)-dependent oxidoreductase [Elusimicrobia bacterium]|nr:SDR family NAD(P)-dependent oxidoreductase [Elusimicrobiota bacterium]
MRRLFALAAGLYAAPLWAQSVSMPVAGALAQGGQAGASALAGSAIAGAQPLPPRAVVTGATSGLGKALAVQLGRQGWRVALVGRREQLLQETAALVEEAGGFPLALAGDVADPESVKRHYAEIKDKWGGVDLALLNAGTPSPMDARKFDAAEVQRVMAVNVGGAANWMGAVLPDMLRQGKGRIAGVASLAAYRGLPVTGPYSASKAALATLLESTRVDLRGTGVQITTINPGFIRTEITKGQELPFMLEAEDAAARILKGIARGDRVISFPWQLSYPIRLLLKNMPNAVYDFVGQLIAEKRRASK